MQSRGAYFLANDRVFDQTVAFLNSFRAHNPDLPLCLIPYDIDIERIRALAARYRFSIFENQEFLSICDEVSRSFHGRVRGHYRKMAIWNGVFEEFLYIDIDTVVLKAVDFVFPLLDKFDVVTSHSNDPHSRKFVWKDSIVPNGEMTAKEIEYATNTGFILSRAGLFDRAEIPSLVEGARRVAEHMELLCVEQPLLNYLMVKSTDRYTSLRHINEADATANLPAECWAGDSSWKIDVDGTSSYDGEPKDVLFVHWAGEMVPTEWEKRLFAILSRCGIKAPAMRLNLKQGRLWRHYRNLHKNGKR
jgi:hypothetical protein